VFESSEVIDRMVERLWERVGSLRRGDTLLHAVVEDVLGVPPHTGHWPQCMKRLRRRLEHELGIAMWPVVGIGYKLLTVGEQLNMLPRERLRRAARQERRARRSVEAIPADQLTPHQRRAQVAQCHALRAAATELRRQLRIQAVLSRKPEGMPRR
jgi:hypothetical protein